jgi:predicted ATPase
MVKDIHQYSPLDHEILSTPYRTQTKWHVFTGAISCGKTTLINLLAAGSNKTVLETGRLFLEGEIATGREFQVIIEDPSSEFCIFELQRDFERKLDNRETIFLDPTLPDCLPFHRFHDLGMGEALSECFHSRYASVFLLDQLPVDLDGVRLEDETYTRVLEDWLYRDYTALGYQVVGVPVLPPQERVEFVLENISESVR